METPKYSTDKVIRIVVRHGQSICASRLVSDFASIEAMAEWVNAFGPVTDRIRAHGDVTATFEEVN